MEPQLSEKNRIPSLANIIRMSLERRIPILQPPPPRASNMNHASTEPTGGWHFHEPEESDGEAGCAAVRVEVESSTMPCQLEVGTGVRRSERMGREGNGMGGRNALGVGGGCVNRTGRTRTRGGGEPTEDGAGGGTARADSSHTHNPATRPC